MRVMCCPATSVSVERRTMSAERSAFFASTQADWCSRTDWPSVQLL
jgi:hypothetical protein